MSAAKRPRVLAQRVLAVLLAGVLLSGCGGQEAADGPGRRVNAAIMPFADCAELDAYLAENNQLQSELYLGLPVAAGGPVFDAVDAAEGGAAPRSGADRFTDTNNQEAGVDEADFLKTDARYIYLLQSGALRIVDAWPPAPGGLQQRSETPIEGTPLALFVHDGLAWVASSLVQAGPAPGVPLTRPVRARLKFTLVDVGSVEAPSILRETYVDGRFNTARRVGSRIFVALHSGAPSYYLTAADATTPGLDGGPLPMPQLEDRPWQDGLPGAATRSELLACGDVYRSDIASGTGLFTLIALDLANPLAPPQTSALLSNSGVVYASPDALYLATYQDFMWIWWARPEAAGDDRPAPGTSVHKFTLADQPRYAASAHVPGQVINQFSLGEHQGFLRIATTEWDWWSGGGDSPRNALYVLAEEAGQLVETGRVEDIGKPGERIFSTRFQGDRGYIVTARQVDPLYTLDLSDPGEPRKIGELEVPGFSTYLHPIADDRLLAIGRDGDGQLQLSLFDVADFAAPRRLANRSVGTAAYSSAEHDHRAFSYYPERGVLAIPVVEQTAWTDAGSAFAPYVNGLRVFTVGAASIEPLGLIEHTRYFDRDSAWYFPAGIRRSLFKGSDALGDYVYAVSGGAITVSDLDQLDPAVDALPLPLNQDQLWYHY